MSKPIVAIIGRPNVGKSTLFNALAGQQISIVKDTPGVTRDRIYADVNWLNTQFTMIDTGGIEPSTNDLILKSMREQAEIAIETADVIIFLTDVRQGVVDADFQVANMIRRSGKPVVLVVNKVDNFKTMMTDVYEFYNLGLGDPMPISGNSKLGLGDMLDEVIKHFKPGTAEEEEDERPHVAIVGKPNVGKSSLINKLTGENRVIVSNIAGTTRDILQEQIQIGGIGLNVIDTAGIRDTEDIVEKIGVNKSREYIEKADLIIYVVDSSTELDENDQEIIEAIQNKKAIVLLNKSDLDTKTDASVLQTQLSKPILSISAKNNTGIHELETLIEEMFFSGKLSFNDEVYITNIRQKNALAEAQNSLKMVLQSIADGMPEDFFTIDMMNAYEALGTIIGESVGEDLVNEIFSKFCMGK